MEYLNRMISVGKLTHEVRIVAMGCIHHGHAACNESAQSPDGSQFWYNYVRDKPDTYLILGGDLVDSIFEKDKRYDEGEVASWCRDKRWGGTLMDRQFNYALEKWIPLAKRGKILWIHEGNHEQEIRKRTSRDMTREWAHRLDKAAKKAGHEQGVAYAGYSALTNLIVQQQSAFRFAYRVTFFSTHGSGAAQSGGAKMNKILAMLYANDTDVTLMWHLHDRMGKVFPSRGISEPRAGKPPLPRFRKRLTAMCGTFLGEVPGVTNYGERKGYAPSTTGPTVVHMRRDCAPSSKQRLTGKATAPTVRLWYSEAVTKEVEE